MSNGSPVRRSWKLGRLVGVGLVVLAAIGGTASAQTKGDTAKARALMKEGRAAAAAGDYPTACAKFAESSSLARAAGPILNLADCEEHLGKLVSALHHWTDGHALLKPKVDDDRIALATEHETKLAAKIPQITVTLGPKVSARVLLDGVEISLASIGAPIQVDPGAHKIIVLREHDAQTELPPVTLAEGERRTITIQPVDAEPPPVVVAPPPPASTPPPPPVAEPPPSHTTRNIGFVAGGVGIAGFGVFGVTAILAAGKHSTVTQHCNADKVCDPEGAAAADAGKTLNVVNAIGLVTGIVGVGVGTTLFIVSSRKKSAPSALTVAPAVGGLRATFEARF